MFTNACSMGNKWAELSARTEGAPVVAITETWLREGTPLSTLWPGHYREYRADRCDGRSGGDPSFWSGIP